MWTSYSFYNLGTVYFISLQSWIEISLINWTVPPRTALFISHNGEGVGGLLASEKKVTMTEWGVVGMILTPIYYSAWKRWIQYFHLGKRLLKRKRGLRCGYCKCIHLQYYNVEFSLLKTYLLMLTSLQRPDWGVWVSVHLPVWKSSDIIFCALLSFLFNLRNCKRDKHVHYSWIGLHFFIRFLVRQRVDSQKETYTFYCIIR